MIKNMKGAIFDLDGVIVDTAKYHYMAWKRLATELGFDFPREENEKLKGVSRTESLEIILQYGGFHFEDNMKHELSEKKNAWYIEYISNINESEILDGARDFIVEIKQRGIKTALGSASKNSKVILGNLCMKELFDVIVDGNMVSKTKPDPEVFLKAAEGLGLEPENCIVFEDSLAGIEGAKRAGMRTVGIGSRNILKEADMIISGLYELLEML